MRISVAIVAALASATFLAPAAAHADARHGTISSLSRCTTTSRGTCIRGGEFCPQASYNKVGYDARGRRYTCKGNRTHPHWMK